MTNNKFKLFALSAAATAVLGSLPTAQAQSNDTLIDKLVQKGILSASEAKELRTENDKDFNKAFSNKISLPSWVESLKLNGDFRGRFDYLGTDNSNGTDRYRLRYRLRLGVTSKLGDDVEIGFRLGSGDGSPLSNNTTFGSNASKKPIYIDTAYAKWTPIHSGDWTVASTIGKMANPFETSAMVFDPDYTPEGAAIQTAYKFNDTHTLKFNGGGFVLDELAASASDPFMLGAQVVWDAKWNSNLSSSLGLAVYDIVNKDNLGTANASVANGNTGNTRDAAGNLVNSYNPFVLSGSVTYTLSSVPLYKGAFPIKVGGEYMENPGASSNNEGYWGGITFGKAVHKGQWELAYRYQYLEADAWYEEVVNDDNVAFYQSALGGKSGIVGGTNVKGHLIQLSYAINDSMTAAFTGYFNEAIHSNPASSPSGATHLMADLMWKF